MLLSGRTMILCPSPAVLRRSLYGVCSCQPESEKTDDE